MLQLTADAADSLTSAADRVEEEEEMFRMLVPVGWLATYYMSTGSVSEAEPASQLLTRLQRWFDAEQRRSRVCYNVIRRFLREFPAVGRVFCHWHELRFDVPAFVTALRTECHYDFAWAHASRGGRTPLHDLAASGHVNMIKELLGPLSDAERESLLSARIDQSLDTPIHMAAELLRPPL